MDKYGSRAPESDLETRVYLRGDQTSVGISVYSKSSKIQQYYYTSDRGNSWSKEVKYGEKPNNHEAQVYEELRDPFNKNILYRRADQGHSVELERSSDGGETWRRVRGYVKGANTSAQVFWPLRFDPNSNRIFACLELPWSYGTVRHGMFVSQDGGDTLEFLYETEGWCAWAIAKSNGNIMYGAGLRGSVLKTENGGKTWTLVGQNDEIRSPYVPWDAKGTARETSINRYGYTEVRSIAINPTNSDQVFLATSKGIIRTIDGGDAWCVLNLGVPDKDNIIDVVIDPIDNRVVYVGGGVGLLKSNDIGCRWQIMDITQLASK